LLREAATEHPKQDAQKLLEPAQGEGLGGRLENLENDAQKGTKVEVSTL
jgi:hypothetical protein